MDDKIVQLFRKKIEVEHEIENYFKSIGFRFSRKKFVGDLGEYFLKNCNKLFESLIQNKTSNDSFDFLGVLKGRYQAQFVMAEPLKIEVKTRYAQEGTNHLFGLNTSKFDVLAFVQLDSFYQCRYIALLKSGILIVDNQKRIRFTKSYKEQVIWEEEFS